MRRSLVAKLLLQFVDELAVAFNPDPVRDRAHGLESLLVDLDSFLDGWFCYHCVLLCGATEATPVELVLHDRD